MTKWSKKREVVRNYDGLAALYDAQYADEQNAKNKSGVKPCNPTKRIWKR